MADRTSAALFAEIFEMLAENPDERAKEYAQRFWDMTSGYDFNTCQMECDDTLIVLGLARKREDGRVEYDQGNGMWSDWP